jgi:hypothetical protein
MKHFLWNNLGNAWNSTCGGPVVMWLPFLVRWDPGGKWSTGSLWAYPQKWWVAVCCLAVWACAGSRSRRTTDGEVRWGCWLLDLAAAESPPDLQRLLETGRLGRNPGLTAPGCERPGTRQTRTVSVIVTSEVPQFMSVWFGRRMCHLRRK